MSYCMLITLFQHFVQDKMLNLTEPGFLPTKIRGLHTPFVCWLFIRACIIGSLNFFSLRSLGDYFPAAYNCPHEVQRVGALGDGGKWVCGLSRVQQKPDCIIYSVGDYLVQLSFFSRIPTYHYSVNPGIIYESSFEAEILANTPHCQIWGYDFTVKSFGPQIPKSMAPRTHFHAFGLAGSDKHDPQDTPPMYTLDSLMKMNGEHTRPVHFSLQSSDYHDVSSQATLILTSSKSISKVGNSRPSPHSLSRTSKLGNPFPSDNSSSRFTSGTRSFLSSSHGGRLSRLLG